MIYWTAIGLIVLGTSLAAADRYMGQRREAERMATVRATYIGHVRKIAEQGAKLADQDIKLARLRVAAGVQEAQK